MTPLGPQDFPLSRDWWLSGSAWHEKTAADVWAVLGVTGHSARTRIVVVRNYYADRQDRLALVPEQLKGELGLEAKGPTKVGFLSSDASDEDIDSFVDFLRSSD